MSQVKLAQKLYEKYCESVGGKAFNGDPLPDWKTFLDTPGKEKQGAAWVNVAGEAMRLCRAQK